MPPNHNPNDRGHNRRTSYIIVEYRVKEGVFRDILKNIGARGLFVNTTRSIAAQQSIELKFPLFEFDHHIEVKGTVVRTSPTGFAVELDQPIEGMIAQSGQMPDIVHEIDRES
jgi:Tfp pilus assembly protein PilZ